MHHPMKIQLRMEPPVETARKSQQWSHQSKANLECSLTHQKQNSRCHRVLNRLCSLNDLFQAEHEDQLNQIIQKDILIQQHYVDIDTR